MKNVGNLIVIALSAATLMCSCSKKPDHASEGEKTEAVSPVDQTKLIGKWLRPDGGYILEIRDANTDGKLDAGYFNPSPINVSEATWRRSEELGLVISVELRDVGYPGATYRLQYQAADDTLTGVYYQPTYGETFAVVFQRQ